MAHKPYKDYVVKFVAVYEVEALDDDEAVDIAIEQHEMNPEGTWIVEEKTDA